jgi:hypothetical protein
MLERELDAAGRPTYRYKSVLRRLAQELLKRECIIFLGAGASVDTKNEDLPTGTELSKKLATDCGLEWHAYIPLSTVSFYYEFFFERHALDRELRTTIGNPAIPPSSTIRALIDLIAMIEDAGQSTFTITTNYDQQFERAYRDKRSQDPGVIIYKGASDPRDSELKLHAGIDRRGPKYWLPDSGPRSWLYKMHGCITQPENHGLVVTEEDYINFLTNTMSTSEHKRLLTYALGQIAFSTILFIGYSLSDWNFRVIYKTTVENAEGKSGTSYAVQYRGSPTAIMAESSIERTRWDSLADFWRKKDVDIINADAATFMTDLLEAVREVAVTAQSA